MENKNISAFRDARFGMFIHFGLYSILGGRWHGQRMDYIGEWIQSQFRIPNDEYARLAEQFNPHCFNADEWVKYAKDAGMAYIVFTAKHHDGFAMYHSRVSRYNIVDTTPFGRDVLRELAYACRRHDIKLGIYYSHCLDWHEHDGADPGAAAGKNFGMSWGNDWDFPDYQRKDFSRYFEQKTKPQIKELLSEYGPVFLIWFDCPLQITPEQGLELRSMVKTLQPDCLINSRIGHNLGDFGSLSDNQHPAGQTTFPLESPNTLNHTWGFKKDDHAWLSATQVVSDLAALSDKNVNYLLNVGPRPDGRLPEASVDILQETAEWRRTENVVIQNTRPNPFPQSFPWGWCTVNGNSLQFFVRDWSRTLTINGLRNKIRSCTVPFLQQGESVKISLPEYCDSLLPVIKVEFEGELDIDQRLIPQNGVIELMPSKSLIHHGTMESRIGVPPALGAAAEILEEGDKCLIDSSGALTQWHHAGDGASWQIYVPEGGKYEIAAITENRRHSAPWVGGRTVEVKFSAQTLKAELKADENINSDYYCSAVSKFGSFNVLPGESGTITFKTLGITNREAINMNLLAVRFQRIM